MKLRRAMRSLGWKLALPSLAACALAAAGGLFVISRTFSGLVAELEERRAWQLAEALNDFAEITGQSADLVRTVNSLSGQRDVSLVVVAGGNPPVVIAASKNAWIGKRVDTLPNAAVAAEMLTAIRTGERRYEAPRDSPQHRLVMPLLLAERTERSAALSHGALYVAMERGLVHAALRRSELSVAALLVLALGALLALSSAVLRRVVLRPLGAIAAAVHSRAAGAEGVFAPVPSRDEIGHFAAALNRMLRVLDSSRERSQVLWQNVPDGLLAIDDRGTVVALNPAGTAILGCSEADAVGSPAQALLPGIAALPTEPHASPRAEGLGRRRDGSEFPVELRMRHLVAGEDSLSIVLFRDITEEREQAAALTHALAEAERANRAKSEFLSTMSHEIRTPLNGILGMTRELLQRDLDDDQRALARTAEASGKALLAVVNDLLDFDKIEAGRLELERIEFAPRDIGTDVVRVLEPQARDRGIELSVHVAPTVPLQVTGDPTRVRQILLNLVGNAVKFTAAGSVRIGIEPAPGAIGAHALLFRVVDTGKGIAPEHLAGLFERFQQAGASTTRLHGGTGLGLAICRQLTELMGGRIGIDSALGKGSTFWFMLPFEPAEAGAPAAVAQSSTAARRPFAGTRVLVVDDTVVNQTVAKLLLSRFGCIVDVASSAADAVRGAEAVRYDAVLLDCHMPGVDGFDAARLLRQLEQVRGAPRVPIVATTADVTEATRARCLAAGMDDVLTKPLRPERVELVLGELLPRPTATPSD